MKDENENRKTISDPVELDEPIVRGDTKITSLQVRKGKSGEMRGLAFHDLCRLDVSTMHEYLPRVTVPNITKAEAVDLEPADLLALSMEAANFFLPRGMRPDSLSQ
jgi:hypothetical protein